MSGKFDGKIAYDVVQGSRGEPKIKLKAESSALKGVGVQLKGREGAATEARRPRCVMPTWILAARKVTVGEVSSKSTRVALVRDKNGDFNAQKLAARPRRPPGPVAKPAPAAKAGPDWLVEVKRGGAGRSGRAR